MTISNNVLSRKNNKRWKSDPSYLTTGYISLHGQGPQDSVWRILTSDNLPNDKHATRLPSYMYVCLEIRATMYMIT